MYRSLRHPIETLRTSPVQFTGITINMSAATLMGYLANETDIVPIKAVDLMVLALNMGCVAANAMLAKNKIELRDRLELTLEEYGFDDRVMGRTTKQYCTRQAARVACQNTGFIEEYDVLCDERSDDAEFTWLPHV